ncbi:winged helix-turn-helix transcriptional regulator [Candidatus Bathyarchaeota archaeon]|nr:winged helix-turn-helix transcriptional regulator [Candidatus Bathyarchaeota archaeon]
MNQEKNVGSVNLEDILSSRGRVRILKILVGVGELNISEIARRAALNYTTTNQHLNALVKAGLIQEKDFGKIRIFRFREENQRAQAIKQLVNFWESNKTCR